MWIEIFFLYLNRFLKFTTLVALLTIISQASARPYYMQQSPYAHRAVLENDAQEAYFPEHYRNPFIKTPRWEWDDVQFIDRFIAFLSSQSEECFGSIQLAPIRWDAGAESHRWRDTAKGNLQASDARWSPQTWRLSVRIISHQIHYHLKCSCKYRDLNLNNRI